MKKYIILLLALLTITGCNNENTEVEIYTTIYPITFISDYLIGDEVVVKSILNENVDIHDFSIKPSDLTNISNSKLFIDLGYDIVFDTDVIKKSINSDTVFLSLDKELDSDITLQKDNHENVHIWLDPINMISMASIIKEELISLYPKHTEVINSNYTDLLSKLMEIDVTYFNSLNNTLIDTFVSTHDAFSHLNKYGINALSIYDESHSSEPTQKEINEIIDIINEKDIKYIVVENELELSNVNTILNETKTTPIVLYDLSTTPLDNKNYFDIMNENLDKLLKILN